MHVSYHLEPSGKADDWVRMIIEGGDTGVAEGRRAVEPWASSASSLAGLIDPAPAPIERASRRARSCLKRRSSLTIAASPSLMRVTVRSNRQRFFSRAFPSATILEGVALNGRVLDRAMGCVPGRTRPITLRLSRCRFYAPVQRS